MESCVSETASETTGDLIAGHPFFGRKRVRRMFDEYGLVADEDEASSQACLNYQVWSKLPVELLILIFARLPLKNILQIRSLSKFWRSTITSPEFQVAFADASPVRLALMVSDMVDGTMFLDTQENKEECFRSGIARCQEVVLNTNIVATADGLLCAIETEEGLSGSTVGVRVFIMNVVTGLRRELPPPSIMTSLPTLVRMNTNVMEGGYSIMFLYAKYITALEVSSWDVYDSMENSWSKDNMGAMARLRDIEVFSMHLNSKSYFYEIAATFRKNTRAINVFNFLASSVNSGPSIYTADRSAHVHNVSGELYKLCKREERHGVWKLTCSNRWEMVCECPEVEGIWNYLRIMSDWVVLVFKVPYVCKYNKCGDVGTFVKVFHMLTKSWHTFPRAEYFLWNWGFNSFLDTPLDTDFDDPYLVEVKFDAIP